MQGIKLTKSHKYAPITPHMTHMHWCENYVNTQIKPYLWQL